jgi:aminopeptidase N
LTTNAGFKVAASGRFVAEVPAGDGLVAHSFVLDRPSPPFLYAFAVGRFDEAELDVDGVKLRALGPRAPDLERALAISAPMLRFVVARTGAEFPGSSYLQVFVPDEGTAQEAASFSLLAASALEDVRRDPTEDWIFAHELAHQWFGWLVPCADFADFWLNEGFATFFVAAFKEERWGRAAYEREVALWRARSAKVHATGHDAPLSLSGPGAHGAAPLSAADLQPRGVTYARGALVLYKLREELGDAAFWDGIRRYVRDRAGAGARSEDLRASFEAASGRDLKGFFARWVYQTAPDL